jgi:acyl-coenzyme A synthetase/AMP-(fatty) acid ligase
MTDPAHFDAVAPHLKHQAHPLRFVVADNHLQPATKPLPAWYPYRHSPNDPTLVCHSSGTTGIPKGVINHHHQYFVGPRARMKVPMLAPQRLLSAFPHSHSSGISIVMRSIIAGVPTMIVSDQQPDNVLRHIEKFRATTVSAFSGVYAKLAKSDLGRYDLSTVAQWINTGDSAHEAHVRQLIRVGSRQVDGQTVPGSVFLDTLGSSEMGYSMFIKEHYVGNERYGRCIGKPFGFVKEAVILGDNG